MENGKQKKDLFPLPLGRTIRGAGKHLPTDSPVVSSGDSRDVSCAQSLGLFGFKTLGETQT